MKTRLDGANIEFPMPKEGLVGGHDSSPVALDLDKAKYTPENGPELFPTVLVKMSKACSSKAQELVTKVWT